MNLRATYRLDDLTGEQWLDILLAQDRPTRIRYADAAVARTAESERGAHCFMSNHAAQLEEATIYRSQMAFALRELRESLDEFSDAARPGVEAVLCRLEQI